MEKTKKVKAHDKVFWLLIQFAAIYILGNIGTGSLSTWDEAVYANVSGNIVETGDWLIMHEGGKPWFDKPPLYMWCTAFFYNIFGINEFSVRLTSGLFGVAIVLLVYIFAKKIGNINTAILAALILLASPHYLHFAKMGMLDVAVTFFITLMIYLFWMGQDRPSYLFWSGIVLLFAYLTKGFAAILGPAIIFLYCLFSGNLKLLINRKFVFGISISLLMIVVWHLAQYASGGTGAIDGYFGFHLLRRTMTSLDGHTGGLNFYQKVIFNKNKPWGVVFYGSMMYMLWLIIKDKDKRAILVVLWVAVVFTVYSVVRTKLHWYIMPLYPALAIASAIALEKFFRKKAFYFILSIILLGMLIQIPVSWAFKLDYNAKAKAAALRGEKLPYKDNGSIFYYDTIRIGERRSI